MKDRTPFSTRTSLIQRPPHSSLPGGGPLWDSYPEEDTTPYRTREGGRDSYPAVGLPLPDALGVQDAEVPDVVLQAALVQRPQPGHLLLVHRHDQLTGNTRHHTAGITSKDVLFRVMGKR